MRLVVPGWEGNTNINGFAACKSSINLTCPLTKRGTIRTSCPMEPARQFTFVMEAKSVITRPAGGQHLTGPGFYEITGLAWSGEGESQKPKFLRTEEKVGKRRNSTSRF